MSDQSGSSPFQALFESALQYYDRYARLLFVVYEKRTGISLADHPLVKQLPSIESITALLQEQARAFSKLLGSDKIVESLKGVLSALSRVSATAALGHMVCPWPLFRSSTSLTPI